MVSVRQKRRWSGGERIGDEEDVEGRRKPRRARNTPDFSYSIARDLA